MDATTTTITSEKGRGKAAATANLGEVKDVNVSVTVEKAALVWATVRAVMLDLVKAPEFALEVRRALLTMVKSQTAHGFVNGCMMLARAIEKRYNLE